MDGTASWPLLPSLVAFGIAALAIGVCGVLVTERAERLAARTGLGQAMMGAVFLGAMTSLSGLVTSVTAAFGGHPELSVSNAVGGIAVQTAFLPLADLVYRKANLEHAAASETNLVQSALLIVLLALALLAVLLPETTRAGVHPMSLVLVAVYGFGIRLVRGAHEAPMWRPRLTRETARERAASGAADRLGTLRLWGEFLVLASVVAGAGWVVARAGVSIAVQSGLSEGIVGTLFTATSTSLPEAVVAVAAVRRGALSLAVGDVIGGNLFDVLFLAFSDAAYRAGSLYHAVTAVQSYWIALSLLMVSVLLLGLLRRERHGVGNIGFESFVVLILYLGSVVLLVAGATPA